MRTAKPVAKNPAPLTDEQFIQAPQNWPRWPWLPLKRRINPHAETEVAVLHADHTGQDGPFDIYLTCLFLVNTWFPTPEMKTQRFDSVSALLAAGWHID